MNRCMHLNLKSNHERKTHSKILTQPTNLDLNANNSSMRTQKLSFIYDLNQRIGSLLSHEFIINILSVRSPSLM